MKTQINFKSCLTKLRGLILTLIALLTLGIGNVWGADATATYTPSSTSTVTKSGTAPTGSSATFSTTYTDKNQLTNGKKQTLTLSGFDGCTITGIKLNMKRTSSGPNATVNITVNGSTKLANNVSVTLTTTAGDKTVTLANTTTVVGEDKTLVIEVSASKNSIYVYNYQITYTPAVATPRTVSFNTGTGNPSVSALTGTSITLPSVTPTCSGDGWELYGWATSACATSTTTAPTIVGGAGDTYNPKANITLYAVYRKGTVAASTTTTTYTLNGNWTTNNGNWIVIDGSLSSTLATGKYGINSGSTSASSPTSYTDIEQVTFTGSKSSSGSGTVEFFYGSGSSWTSLGSKDFSTSLTWSVSPKVNGELKIVFTRSAGNIYIASMGVKAKLTTYNYYSTPTCCTPLGTINGSVNCASSGDGIVTVSGWTYAAGSTGTTESNVTSYTVKLYKWNSGTSTWALANNNSTTGGASGTQATRTGIAANNKSVTFSGLEYGATYKFTVQAIGTGDYCNGEETAVTTINSNALTDNKFLNKYSIYIDDGNNANYAHNWINSLTSHNGSVDITLSLAEHDYYQYKLSLGGVIWWGNTGKMTTDSKWTFTDGAQNCKLTSGLAGTYTFTFYGATTEVGVEYPKANQSNNRSIWFDKSVITGWTSESASDIFYRIGKTSHNTNNTETGGTAWTLVPGTDRFYTTKTMGYNGFVAWQIANNKSWSGDNNSIYLVNGSGYAITKAINFQKSVVGASGVTVVPTTSNNTENGCNYWNVDVTDGMLKHTATISSYSNGTVTVAYTKYDGTGSASFTSGSNSDLAHRTILTITATPATGYNLTSLKVNGSDFTSGNTHILAADAIIAATFTAKTYDVTLDREGATTGSTSVTMTYNSAAHTSITAPTKTGYTFGGWWSSDNGTGSMVMNASGVLQANVAGYTGAGGIWTKDAECTLYAKWTADEFIDLVQGTVVANKTTTYNFSDVTIADKTAKTTGTCAEVHYHFVGWITKAKYDAGTAIAAGDIQTGSKTPDNTTYYAVWAKEGAESTTTFKRVQTLSDLNSASMIAIVNAFSSSHYIMTTNLATAQTAPTESAGKITVSSGKYWTLEKDGNNWRFKTGSNYLKADYLPAVAKDKKTISTSSGTSGYSSWEILNNSYTSNGTPVFTIKNAAGAYAGLEYSSGWCTYYATDFNTSWYTLQLYVPTRDFSDYVASCGATYDIVLNKNGGTTNGSATVTENYAALNSGFTEPVWAGHMVDYYMVAAASGSTKIAEADGTFAKSVTVSGTPWTDANGKWVKGSGATFYAKWEARQCVITLNHAGADTGHEGTANVTATYGANTNLTTSITKPEKTGYTFGGYYTEENGAGTQLIDANGAWLASKTGYTNGSKQWQLDAATLVLYAKWTIETYTVNWYVNGISVAHEDDVPYGRSYSNLTNEPTVANNALASCNSNKFIGWVTAEGQYTADGGTKSAQYDPYTVTGSTTITADRKDFYAMFATETGSSFDLSVTSGDFKIFGLVSDARYYVTGALSNGAYGVTTDADDADEFTFTKVSDGVYTIKHKRSNKFVKWSSSTNFKEDTTPAEEWTITTASHGSWCMTPESATTRAFVMCYSASNPENNSIFKPYAISNVTNTPAQYYYVEIGGGTLTNYRTGCCDEKITLNVTGATNGAYTLKFNNAAQTSGANVSTCAASTVEFKVTANAGYTLTNMSISGTNKTLTITPSPITTGLPSTNEMTYTVSVPALATGTLTITPTFTQTYSVTYNLDGGETAGSTATTRYQSGESVTLVTPNPTKTGYDFTGWTVTKAGGGTVTVSAGAFTMPSDNVTVTAGWTAKPLTSISVTPTTAEVYVGQYVVLPVTYDPADVLTKGYTLVATPGYCVTTGSTNTTLKLTGGRGGVSITEDKVETVTIKANADNTKTASVTVTVKPLPVDHFLDLVHGQVFADQSASIVDNALSAAYTAPSHADVSEPAEGNTCEKEHLHLVGWIESEWADAHLTATMTEMMAAEDGSGNALFHAAYDPMTASGKTYYAVWGHEVTP